MTAELFRAFQREDSRGARQTQMEDRHLPMFGWHPGDDAKLRERFEQFRKDRWCALLKGANKIKKCAAASVEQEAHYRDLGRRCSLTAVEVARFLDARDKVLTPDKPDKSCGETLPQELPTIEDVSTCVDKLRKLKDCDAVKFKVLVPAIDFDILSKIEGILIETFAVLESHTEA